MGEAIKLGLGDKQYSPEEISSFILRELKKEGERALGCSINKAVITVPAFFNEQQRRSTQIAGELAGLEVVRIINEPTAAALAYGAGNAAGETMLVYDLGGGTFDVSVVVVESGVVEVKASHGDTHLGGDDFDQLLVNHAIQEFKKRHNVDLQGDAKALRRLKVALERAKRTLSDEPFVAVREEYLDGSHHLELEIRRDQYEDMISGLLEKTLECIHQSLNDAKLAPKDINKIMLVGGATRTPMVHRLLKERLGLEPRFEINPDLIVSMGAAIQAGVIAGEKRHSILVDITPHTYSTGALCHSSYMPDLMCVPIIPRNTPLPASKSEAFRTVIGNQDKAEITVYQGESTIPEENNLIGTFFVEGLGNVPAGNLIVIHYDLDVNGMLKVTATEKNTGLAKTVALDTRGQKVLNVDEARKNIASLVGKSDSGDAGEVAQESDMEEDAESMLATAKDLRKRAESLLEKKISDDDSEEIRNLLHASSQAIKERDWTTLGAKNDTLSDLLFYLED
jgi:molecular chaperone DnaK